MTCPKCHGKTKVRKTFDAMRLRICTACKYRFFTQESFCGEPK